MIQSDNRLRFRKNLMEKFFLESLYNKLLTIDDQIKDEILQYDIDREAAKISALSSGKIGKYERKNIAFYTKTNSGTS